MMKLKSGIRPLLIGVAAAMLAAPAMAATTATTATTAKAPAKAQVMRMQIPADVAKNGFQISSTLIFPPFNPATGRKVFAEKGCVVCHRVNGIGGTDGPNLSYGKYDTPVNAMDIASDLWANASVMIPMQQDELGSQIKLTPEDLSAIVAFIASPSEQKKFSKKDIPAKMLKAMENM